MAEDLLKDFGASIAGLTLIPSSGGVYEVMVDGQLIFSKKKEGRHPELTEITPQIKARL